MGNLREAAQQALEVLELCQSEMSVKLFDMAVTTLRDALDDTQDWDEIKALRASLREHMAEIHRLRAVCRQALEPLEKEARSFEDWLNMMKAARTSLRAALAEDATQRLTDVHQEMEAVTDRHDLKQARASVISNLLEHFGITSANSDVNVAYLHKQLDDLLTVSVGRSEEGDKLSPPLDAPETNFGNMAQAVDSTETDHIRNSTKMIKPVAYVTGYFDGKCVISPIEHVVLPTGMALYRSPPTSQESRQVDPVAWRFFDGKMWCYVNHIADLSASAKFEPLYTAPPKREPLTERMAYEAETLLSNEFFRNAFCLGWQQAERAHGIGGEE